MAAWEVWLSDPAGNRITLLDRAGALGCTRVRNGIGACVITLPAEYDNLWGTDYILEYWRQPEGGALKLFNAYMIRHWLYQDSADGNENTVLWGLDGNYLLSGRTVAFDSESAQALMTAEYDDMMKAVVTDALAGDAGTGRDLTSVGGGVTVAGNLTAAPSGTKAFAWDNVFEALLDISQASKTAGTPLYFDMVPSYTSAGLIAWQFQTFTTRRGVDHSSTSSNPVYFGRQWGNLDSCYYEIDHTDELNYIYGRGKGEKAARFEGDAYDATRYGASIWNRREGYCNASAGGGGESVASTTSAAQAKLDASKPVITAGGVLLDTPQARYDIDWGFGDSVVMETRKKQVDVDIIGVSWTVDDNGQEAGEFRAEVTS